MNEIWILIQFRRFFEITEWLPKLSQNVWYNEQNIIIIDRIQSKFEPKVCGVYNKNSWVIIGDIIRYSFELNVCQTNS